ncbi:MAG: hypothetical protein Q9166_007661 [cf. Caloplaca sp. 2 TL-2023]
MNPLRHDLIRSCVSSSPPSTARRNSLRKRYLGVGCGGGIFAESAARLVDTESVLGIDPSKLPNTRGHAMMDPLLTEEVGRLRYENVGIEELEVPEREEEEYDVLTLFEVIEHVSVPGAFLEKCMPFVRPGGWVVLSTIARSWTSWVTTETVVENLMGVVPRGTHDWGKYVDEGRRGGRLGRRGWGVKGWYMFPGWGGGV